MTPLRQKMLEHMILKGYAQTTQKSYINHIRVLSEYFGKSPAELSEDELREPIIDSLLIRK